MPDRRLLATTAAIAALSFILILLVIPVYGDRSESAQLQTWPSRTPTSGPKPTSDGGQPPGGGDPGGSASPTAPPTVPGQDGTATAIGTTPLAASPAPTATQLPTSVSLATAEPCGLPPTALAVEAVEVRLRPGDEFALAGRLSLLAVRPVIGRAASAPWWLVGLENGQVGWVPDRAVIIHGHTGAVEVFEAPAGPGPTPESAQTWNPTPNPICLTPVPISSEEAGGVAAQSQDVAGDGEAGDGETAGGGEPAGVVSGGLAAEVATRPAEAGPAGEASADSGSVSQSEATVSAANLEDLEDGGANLTWLLLIGIALILGGAIAFLFRARFSGSGSTS